jgi:hypothetical protein
LEILTRCHVARGDAGIVTAAVRTMVAAPDRCEAYQQLAAAPEQRAGGQSGLRALHWLTPWFVTDDPRASVVLHKAYGVGQQRLKDTQLVWRHPVPTCFGRHTTGR